jgi:hypothetical protein
MQRVFLRTLVLAAAVVAATGCDNELEDLPPTEPAPTITETFTGTIGVNGAMSHTFTVVASGTVTATLTEVTPDTSVAVGFALGRWNTSLSFCEQIIPKDDAVQGQILTGNAAGIGTLCTRVYDTGKLTAPLNYTLTVVHP